MTIKGVIDLWASDRVRVLKRYRGKWGFVVGLGGSGGFCREGAINLVYVTLMWLSLYEVHNLIAHFLSRLSCDADQKICLPPVWHEEKKRRQKDPYKNKHVTQKTTHLWKLK